MPLDYQQVTLPLAQARQSSKIVGEMIPFDKKYDPLKHVLIAVSLCFFTIAAYVYSTDTVVPIPSTGHTFPIQDHGGYIYTLPWLGWAFYGLFSASFSLFWIYGYLNFKSNGFRF